MVGSSNLEHSANKLPNWQVHHSQLPPQLTMLKKKKRIADCPWKAFGDISMTKGSNYNWRQWDSRRCVSLWSSLSYCIEGKCFRKDTFPNYWLNIYLYCFSLQDVDCHFSLCCLPYWTSSNTSEVVSLLLVARTSKYCAFSCQVHRSHSRQWLSR